MKYAVGQKIYYTGDMANRPGWFTIAEAKEAGAYSPKMYTLKEINGDREFKGVFEMGIGDKYEGHCGTRFVAEFAYKLYQKQQEEKLQAWLNRNKATN